MLLVLILCILFYCETTAFPYRLGNNQVQRENGYGNHQGHLNYLYASQKPAPPIIKNPWNIQNNLRSATVSKTLPKSPLVTLYKQRFTNDNKNKDSNDYQNEFDADENGYEYKGASYSGGGYGDYSHPPVAVVLPPIPSTNNGGNTNGNSNGYNGYNSGSYNDNDSYDYRGGGYRADETDHYGYNVGSYNDYAVKSSYGSEYGSESYAGGDNSYGGAEAGDENGDHDAGGYRGSAYGGLRRK